MTNIEDDVSELYNRAEDIRQQAQADSRRDSERRGGTAKPRRRLANRVVLGVIGFGMVLYGVISIAARMAYEGAGVPPPPSAGIIASTQTVNSCEAGLQSLNEVEVGPSQTPTQGLTPEEAEQTADSLLRRYLGFEQNTYPVLLGGPALVDITLPGGSKQQAWARLWIPDINPVADALTGTPISTPPVTVTHTPLPAGTAGPSDIATQTVDASQTLGETPAEETRGVDAHVLYISSSTGDPLLLIQNLKVQDPLLAGCQETVVHELTETMGNRFQSLPSFIFNIALLALGFIALLSWQRSR